MGVNVRREKTAITSAPTADDVSAHVFANLGVFQAITIRPMSSSARAVLTMANAQSTGEIGGWRVIQATSNPT